MPAKTSVFRPLFGSADAGFAWGLAAVSGVFAWIFLVDADLSGWRYRRVETAPALVEYCERTEHDVGGPPRRQGGGQVDGVERSNRLAWEGSSRAIHDLSADPQEMPVRGRVGEMRSAIGRVGLRQLPTRGGADQDAVALDDCQV